MHLARKLPSVTGAFWGRGVTLNALVFYAFCSCERSCVPRWIQQNAARQVTCLARVRTRPAMLDLTGTWQTN